MKTFGTVCPDREADSRCIVSHPGAAPGIDRRHHFQKNLRRNLFQNPIFSPLGRRADDSRAQA